MKSTLIEYIKENKGATVDTKTLKPVKLEVGFAVALTNYYTTIENYGVMSLIIEELRRHQFPYIGFWLDGDKLYIDGVVIEMLKNVALAKAKRHNQKAIWDFLNSEEVVVN